MLEAKSTPFRGCSNVKQVPPVTRQDSTGTAQAPTPRMSNSNANMSQINKACSRRAMSLTCLTYIQSTVSGKGHPLSPSGPLGRDASLNP